MKVKQLTTLSMFTLLAVLINGLELLIPMNAAIPGIKLGLSNIVVLFVIYRFGARKGILLTSVKALLSALLFGGFAGLLYAGSGALCSGIVMGLSYKNKYLTPIGVSILGASAHISAQICCAFGVIKSVYVFSYYPFLLLTSAVCGALNGTVIALIQRKYMGRKI